jgi:hypothetical protein
LNGHALSIKRGRYVLFLREICPPKKMTPKGCPVNGTVTGVLLILSIGNFFGGCIHTYIHTYIHTNIQIQGQILTQ